VTSADTPWLFDLGNSRLKGAWLRADELAQPFALAWDAPDFDAVLQVQLARWPAPTHVLIASVVSAARADRLRTALQASPQAAVLWLRSPRQGCGIINSYREPERLGIDRFLAMAAARAAADNAGVIVVGCGTALTLDLVDPAGSQREGLIAPSPDLMMSALRGATAIVEENRDAFENTQGGDDTARALREGCTRAAAALVGWYHARHCDELGDPRLWLHGGWAESLRALLEEEGHTRVRVLDNAVLRGLVLWATARNSV